MPEILPHPFGGSPPDPVSDPQRTLRGGCLQFVSERVVIPAVAVVQKTPDGAEEVDRAGAKLFFCGSDFTNFFFLIHDVPQPNRGLKVAHPARRFLYVWLQVKNRRSAGVIPVLPCRSRIRRECPDRSKEIACSAHTRRGRAVIDPLPVRCERAAPPQKFAGYSGPPACRARAEFLAHWSRLQIVAGCVAVPPQPAG